MTIAFTEEVTPALARLSAALNGKGRLQMWRAVAGALEVTTRKHIRGLEGTRHRTARALGAEPTGRLSQAIAAVSSEATERGCSVGVADPIFTRAGRDVTIRPRRGNALAIPIHKLAYGRLPRELKARGIQLFRLGKRQPGGGFFQKLLGMIGLGRKDSSSGGILAMADPDGDGVIPLYALRKSVTQKQDRTLLPSDEEYRAAAEGAGIEFLNAIQPG